MTLNLPENRIVLLQPIYPSTTLEFGWVDPAQNDIYIPLCLIKARL